MDSSDGELKTSTARPALSLGTSLSSFSTTGHDVRIFVNDKVTLPLMSEVWFIYDGLGS